MGITYAHTGVRNNIVKKEDLLIVEPDYERREYLKKEGFTDIEEQISSRLNSYDLIILAVKPDVFKTVGPQLKGYLAEHQIVLSVMAGVRIETIQKTLGHYSVIRAMPNTPSQMGYGITGYTAGSGVSDEDLQRLEPLLKSTGKTIRIREEEYLDVVTAVSGSGPAYFYYFVKNMIAAGKEMGMDESDATLLVKQTMLGAYHLMNHSNVSPSELIDAVASKGGTTQAALDELEEYKVGEGIRNAMKSARNRAEEISKK